MFKMELDFDISKFTRGLNLENREIRKLTVKALTKMTDVAKKSAKEFVPYKTGRLEKSIVSQVYKRKRIGVIRVNRGRKASKYAVYIHDDMSYNLGEGSLRKRARLGVRVDRGYLSRAVFKNRRRFKKIIKRTMRR